ncbi:MAG: XRE family transcriptional regulator [Alphaproteobacteria bacterium]|nr:MAG: XRE family transcriptional regulator [Alphaproteobacteria bacterium]
MKSKDIDNVIDAIEDLKFDMQFAVKAAMKKNRVSQKQLAEKMGCSASNVSQMLSAEANPQIDSIARALALLNEDFAFVSDTLHGRALVEFVRENSQDDEAIVKFVRSTGKVSGFVNCWMSQIQRNWIVENVDPCQDVSVVTANKMFDWARSQPSQRKAYAGAN